MYVCMWYTNRDRDRASERQTRAENKERDDGEIKEKGERRTDGARRRRTRPGIEIEIEIGIEGSANE